jgi:dihydroorotase
MMTELLQQARLLDPGTDTDQVGDVLIGEQGRILAVAPQITEFPADTIIRDCRGLIVAPGLVDLYSYPSEPGYESRETLAQFLQAAQAGGFTRLTLLPNSQPPLDRPSSLAWFRARLAELRHQCPDLGRLHINFWGGLTHKLEGAQMSELAELAAAGVVGFSDGLPLQNLGLLQNLLDYLQPLQQPIALYPSDSGLAGQGVVREGVNALRFGLPGVTASTETAALAAILELVAARPIPIHIMRVSTARSVTLLRTAQAQGLPVTASTTWHHLLLDTEALHSYHPSLHLHPPLGNPDDRKALRQGISEGVIQSIAIDHRAYTYEEKTVPFAEAPVGAVGLELALSLLWQQLVVTGVLKPLQLWAALSHNPARCLNQAPPSLQPGESDELILFDPQATWTVETGALRTPAQNTYYWGQSLTGRVVVRSSVAQS